MASTIHHVMDTYSMTFTIIYLYIKNCKAEDKRAVLLSKLNIKRIHGALTIIKPEVKAFFRFVHSFSEIIF